MIRQLVHDPIFFAGKSEPAGRNDLQTARDLLDTLMAHREICVGMAANMIGVRKRIIAFLDKGSGNGKKPVYTVMLNPVIESFSTPFETEEGCVSLLGNPRKTTRYRTIRVSYQTVELQPLVKTYHGWTAQIIQHEIDHCNGILI